LRRLRKNNGGRKDLGKKRKKKGCQKIDELGDLEETSRRK